MPELDFAVAWERRLQQAMNLIEQAGSNPFDWKFETDVFGNLVVEFIGFNQQDVEVREHRARVLTRVLEKHPGIFGIRRRGSRVWIALLP